jgi:hypothetical protein
VNALPEHLQGDGPCSRCGTVDHPVWFTDSPFWNEVVRSAPLPWLDHDGDGLMCLNCFVKLVDERGFRVTRWRVLPEFKWVRETRP